MSNYSYMRDRMIDALTQISRANFADAPNYKLMVLFCERFKADGIPAYIAERLVAGMKISVSQQCIEDDELIRRVVDTYGVAVRRMLDQIRVDFSSNPYDMLVAMAPQFEITLDF